LGHSFEDYRTPIKSANEKPIKDDQALRTKLKQASKNVPKYLFRTWHADSGGNRKLNTTTAITPLAFASSKDHNSVYDMTRSEFTKNTMSHLGGAMVLTEFPSWFHSPYFAFYYTHRRKSSDSVHVAIIDTEEMAKPNPAFHVPALGRILGSGGYDYEEEYLIRGVIGGHFYKAVSYDKICELGLLKHLPTLSTNTISPFDVRGIRAIPGGEVNYAIDELRQLRSIALSSGDILSVLVPGFWSKKKHKTYSSRDSHVVTHRSTNLPFNCLCMAERTGCPVFS
ncbi:hypothetical protein KCU61_g9704, partial [Aureobasidium melanogenum]